MAAAAHLAPVGVGAVDDVGEVGEGVHHGDGEPVAGGLGDAELLFDVVGEVRQGVALAQAALGGDLFVAPGEADGLEGDEGDLPGVVAGEADDGPDLVVVHPVDEGDDQDDFNAGLVHVLDGLQLDVEQVPHLAVAVGVVADAVELQVGVAQPGLEGPAAELLGLGELDAVGGRLHAVVAELAGVAHGVDEVGRHGGLAAGELHRHLPARLDLHGVVEHFGDVFPSELMDEAHLVGVHEAGVAHHVAAVGEVDGQHRAAPVFDGAGAVLV